MTRVLVLTLLFAVDQRTSALVEEITLSGQAVELAVSPSERLGPPARIAPGAPPLLGFRVMEGKLRHRFGDLGLVMDDAGH
jgi:hypothetical protein